MISAPSRKSRTPSSAATVKVLFPAGNEKRPVQRTEKLSAGRPAGPAPPQLYMTADSQAVRTGEPLRATLLKYSARNWPVGQPLLDAAATANGCSLETTPLGLRTVTGTTPATAMSAAVML